MTNSTTISKPEEEDEKLPEGPDAIDLYLERMGKVTETPTALLPFDDYFDGNLEEEPSAPVDPQPAWGVPSPVPEGWKEVVLDKNGQPRQAGADLPEGEWIKEFRKLAEEDLYAFAYGILGYTFLSEGIHYESCKWLQKIPPFRKLLMLPRLHAKSAIVSQALPVHIIIQSAATNCYMPGLAGTDCRILMACETETLGKKWLRVVKSTLMRNQLVQAFWPHVCWENPRQQSPKWSETEIIVPRENEWPDPTVRAIGVGGAITGARPNILIEDDLISLEAANSEVVMQGAIDWHVAARALLDEYEEESGLQSLEMILGTHWAAYDLYKYIEDNDPSVEVLKRAIYEPDDEGQMQITWPERWSWDRIEQLKKEFGSLFPLLYMNDPYDPSITDFDIEKIRKYAVSEEKISFFGDIRDVSLEKKEKTPLSEEKVPGKAPATNLPLTPDNYPKLFPEGGREYLMHKWKKYRQDAV
jgi:hypothetical protein